MERIDCKSWNEYIISCMNARTHAWRDGRTDERKYKGTSQPMSQWVDRWMSDERANEQRNEQASAGLFCLHGLRSHGGGWDFSANLRQTCERHGSRNSLSHTSVSNVHIMIISMYVNMIDIDRRILLILIYMCISMTFRSAPYEKPIHTMPYPATVLVGPNNLQGCTSFFSLRVYSKHVLLPETVMSEWTWIYHNLPMCPQLLIFSWFTDVS